MNKIITFGCRLNFYESEIIKNHLDSLKREDLVVVHSCAVTSEAERQVKQKIRKIYQNNSEKKIIVVGCAVQLNPSEYINIPGVVKVLGNVDKLKYENYIDNAEEDKVVVNDIEDVDKILFKPINKFANKSRAFIEIQNGCNHSCTFCVITKVRGLNRSLPIENIIEKIKEFIDNGYNEVVFTGVDITDYGSDIYGKRSLGSMIRKVLIAIPQLQRLRLSSIDVAEVDDELLDVIISESRVMPHLHLSIQSGSNLILKRMKRRHNREQVIKFCNTVKNRRPDIAFGADIITGFPTETDVMFEETVNLVKEIGIVYLHVFPYSERIGTSAARMPQVARDIRKSRASDLRKIANEQLLKFYSTLFNTKQRVVVEKNNMGHTENFALIRLKDIDDLNLVKEKEVVDVFITGIENNFLLAKVC